MSALEAKIVVLGAQGVGKTSLVQRFIKGHFNPEQVAPTVGASFLTKRVVDSDTDTVVRLQIWDTAGQERFRSISRLYYRGANACILCYSITDAASFKDMGVWLMELRKHLPHDVVLHVVGTKADIVTRDPSARQVPFERCIAYVAENLAPGLGSTPPPTATPLGDHPPPSHSSAGGGGGGGAGGGGFVGYHAGLLQHHKDHPNNHNHPNNLAAAADPHSPGSKRSSGFWGQEVGWDACHEISAESGDGVEEVFRVVTRKLVEQSRKMQQALLNAMGTPGSGITPGMDASGYDLSNGGGGGGGNHGTPGYFDAHHNFHQYHQQAPNGAQVGGKGSFRVGRDRRSWLFSPAFSPAVTIDRDQRGGTPGAGATYGGREEMDGQALSKSGKCC